jgi:hypothetical protein
LDSFEFRTQSNLQFTVVSEDSASVAQLREAFIIASKKAPVKRTLARQFGKGVYSAINVPWKLTNMMVLSLEKVILLTSVSSHDLMTFDR